MDLLLFGFFFDALARFKLILKTGIIRVYAMKYIILFAYLMGIESTETAFELLVKQVLVKI